MEDWIAISVIKARNLAVADLNGFSDPYVIVKVGKQTEKTKIIKKNLNPEWNETFNFNIVGCNKILIAVIDWDRISSDDFLGAVEIDISTLALNGTQTWYPLAGRPGKGDKVLGDICLAFSPGAKPINMSVVQASDLLLMIKERIQASQTTGGLELDLSGCEMRQVPRVVQNNFSALHNFNLGFNKFVSFPELDAFNYLEILDLNGNQITNFPATLNSLKTLKELSINGNKLVEIPDSIGVLICLEKLSISNNQIQRISDQIGRLSKLEELNLNGNPLSTIPKGLGCCISMELLDLSSCHLTTIPGEFTYMTRLMELNLASNQLTELPASIGRLSRLVRLNLSDNKLTDLPLSMGYCIGLGKIGAGVNLERNPIKDNAMLDKYRIGTDHLIDYLEKRMDRMGGPPKLEEFPLLFVHQTKPQKSSQASIPKPKLKPTPVLDPSPSNSSTNLDEKLTALRKWANVCIQSELRPEIQKLQSQANSSSSSIQLVQIAQDLRGVRTEMDKAKEKLPPFQAPQPCDHPDKIQRLRGIVQANLEELAIVLRSIQTVLNETSDSQKVLSMVQIVKSLRSVLIS